MRNALFGACKKETEKRGGGAVLVNKPPGRIGRRPDVMSMRPKQVADHAASFSLRDLVVANTPREEASQREPPTAASPQVVAERSHSFVFEQPRRVPAPPLPVSGPASVPGNLTFTLPAMAGSKMLVQSAGPVSANSNRVFSPGYLAGGGRHDQNEVLRLTAVVDDLKTRLAKTQDKLTQTEASVTRANMALQAERASAHARIAAATAEVGAARDLEARLKTQLANLPKTDATTDESFLLKAEKAVQMESMYAEKVAEADLLRAQISKAEEAVRETRARLLAAEEATCAHAEETEALRNQLAAAEEAAAQLETATEEACSQLEAAQAAERDAADEASRALKLEGTLFTLTNEKAELISTQEKLSKDLETAKADLAAALQKNEEYEASIRSLSNELACSNHADLEILKAKFSEACQQNRDYEARIESLSHQVALCSPADLEIAKTELSKALQKNEAYEASIESLSQEVSLRQDMETEAAKAIAEHKQRISDLQKRESENAVSMGMAIDAARAEAVAFKSAMEEAISTRDATEKKLQDVTQRYEKTSSTLKTAEAAFSSLARAPTSTSFPPHLRDTLQKYNSLFAEAESLKQAATREGATPNEQLRYAKAYCLAMRHASALGLVEAPSMHRVIIRNPISSSGSSPAGSVSTSRLSAPSSASLAIGRTALSIGVSSVGTGDCLMCLKNAKLESDTGAVTNAENLAEMTARVQQLVGAVSTDLKILWKDAAQRQIDAVGTEMVLSTSSALQSAA